MEGVQMSNYLGDTNKMVKPETYMTIHADGRITVSDKLKPDETAARVLECMKTQFLGDAQATKIREQQDRIKRLEDWKESALEIESEWDANAIARMLGAKLGESQRKVIQREVPNLLARIKRLEEAGDAILNANNDDEEYEAIKQWYKVKEAKP
jgi:hypothetical protein